MQALNAPTPGNTTPRADLNLADIAGDQRVEADPLQPFLHAAQIAHPVIDNRNHIS